MSKNTKAWVITLIGSLFFFFGFFQTNIFTSLSSSLAKDLNATSFEISFLSAWFFYANMLFLIPAGLLLDRYSLKILMAINMLLIVIGTFIFAISDSFLIISIARFLSGIMMAFGLIICLKLASLSLKQTHMALASSLIVTIGMLGGITAQTPMAFLVKNFGWRHSLLLVALLGIFIGIILWFVIKDPRVNKLKNFEIPTFGIFNSILKVIKNPQNWFCGFFISFINFPIAILGALFGISYFTHVYKFSTIQASSITSMLFLGIILGSPIFGFLSDYFRKRKFFMLLGSFICLILMSLVLYIDNLSFALLHILIFFIGFTSGTQVLGYPIFSEINPPSVSGLAFSLGSFLIVAIGYGFCLPLIGKILLIFWDGKVVDGADVYSMRAYKIALGVIPIGILLAIIMAFFIKEGNNRRKENILK